MTKFVVNPFLCCKYCPDGFVVDDYLSKRTYALGKNVLILLSNVIEPKSRSDLCEFAACNYIPVQLIDQMIECSLLIEQVNPRTELAATKQNWDRYGWDSAAYYHLCCFRYPFNKYDSSMGFRIDSERMNSYLAESQPPPLSSGSADMIDLKIGNRGLDLLSSSVSTSDVLQRKSGKGSMLKYSPHARLSALLDLTFGVRSMAMNGILRTFRKTIPSGGARHPTDAYVWILSSELGQLGFYRYDPINDILVERRFRNAETLVEDVSNGAVTNQDQPAFGLILVSHFERSMWRYREVRSTRAILADLGHAIQQSCDAAWAYGFELISDCPVQESLIYDALGLNPMEDGLMHICFFTSHGEVGS